jgi:hypothetical protein
MNQMENEQTIVLENRPWIGMDVHKENFSAALYVDPRPGAPDLKSMPTKGFKRDAHGVSSCMEWAENLLARRRPGSPARGSVWRQRGATPSIWPGRFFVSARVGAGDCQSALREEARREHGAAVQERQGRCPCLRVLRGRKAASCLPSLQPAFQELQELARERKSIVEQRTSLGNRMADTGVSKIVCKSQKQLMKQYDKLVEKLDAAITEAMENIPALNADAQAVTQIPGVAKVVSAVTMSELGDLRNFRCSRSISAAAGVNPRVVECGKSKGKTRMSKQGNGRVRAVLYCAAMACLKTKDDHWLKRFYNRLVSGGKTHMQALGALMRKIIVLMRALVISGKPFDPDYDLKARLSTGLSDNSSQPVENLS